MGNPHQAREICAGATTERGNPIIGMRQSEPCSNARNSAEMTESMNFKNSYKYSKMRVCLTRKNTIKHI